jgi:hypothetical protein
MLSNLMRGCLTGADDPRVVYLYSIIKELYPNREWRVNDTKAWCWGSVYLESSDCRLVCYHNGGYVHMRKTSQCGTYKIGCGNELYFDDHEELKKKIISIVDSIL